MKKRLFASALLLILLSCLTGCSSPSEVHTPEYQLPETKIPAYVVPDRPTSTYPEEVSEWVMTNYDNIFSWEDSDGKSYVVHVTLPAIEPVAKFATDYNNTIEAYAKDLLDDIMGAAQNGEYVNTCTVNYDAYLYDDLLSILITEQYDSGECDYYVSTFDVVELVELSTTDLAERLLGLDYASFLLASNLVVERDYIDRYYQEIHEIPTDKMTDAQLERLDTYGRILNSMPTDTFNLYYRDLYVNNDGEVMLVFQGILISDDWQYGLDTTDSIAPINLRNLYWTDVPQSEALHNLMTLEISDRRYYPEFYSYLLQEALLNDPAAFIGELAFFSDEGANRVVDYIFYAAWDEQCKSINNICFDLLENNDLWDAEEAILTAIIERTQ